MLLQNQLNFTLHRVLWYREFLRSGKIFHAAIHLLEIVILIVNCVAILKISLILCRKKVSLSVPIPVYDNSQPPPPNFEVYRCYVFLCIVEVLKNCHDTLFAACSNEISTLSLDHSDKLRHWASHIYLNWELKTLLDNAEIFPFWFNFEFTYANMRKR